MKHLLSRLQAFFFLPSVLLDQHRQGIKERKARVAHGYCSACGREKAAPGYKTCDDCHAVGIE